MGLPDSADRAKRARGKLLTAKIDREIVWSPNQPNRLGESNPINGASQL